MEKLLYDDRDEKVDKAENDELEIVPSEVERALHYMKYGKAPSPDSILAGCF